MKIPFRPVLQEPRGSRRPSLDLALACILFLLAPATSVADVGAHLDRSSVSLGETVQLVLESDDQPSVHPDLSVLAPDFEILDRRSSHSVSTINGQRSERHALILRLRPRRVGQLEIPPISLGASATESLQLSVTPASTEASVPAMTVRSSSESEQSAPPPKAFLEAGLEPAEGYVGQQLVLTAKVFMDGPVRGLQLHDPQIPNAAILPLGEDRYQAERDGKSYSIYERRYAIFPHEPGQLEIDPLLVEGWAPGAGGATGGPGYAVPGQQLRAFSGMLVADLLPLPDGADTATWLPARSLSLTETGPATYRAYAGQRIERRIHLRAEGLLSRNLPELRVQAPYQLAETRLAPKLWDERRPEGVIGNRQETLLLTAREPGHYQLPPLSLRWWDTAAGRWETATLPARDLVVSAAPADSSRKPLAGVAAPARLPQPQPPAETDQTESSPKSPVTPRFEARNEASTANGLWIWIAAVFALAWITTMTVWWRTRRQPAEVRPLPVTAEPPPKTEETDPLKRAIETVRAAYQAGDAGAAREALLAWAQQALPEQKPSNLARLAQRCPPHLRDQILMLEQAFFSPQPIPWDKQRIWEELDGFVPAPPEEPASFRRGKPIRRRAANPDVE